MKITAAFSSKNFVQTYKSTTYQTEYSAPSKLQISRIMEDLKHSGITVEPNAHRRIIWSASAARRLWVKFQQASELPCELSSLPSHNWFLLRMLETRHGCLNMCKLT